MHNLSVICLHFHLQIMRFGIFSKKISKLSALLLYLFEIFRSWNSQMIYFLHKIVNFCLKFSSNLLILVKFFRKISSGLTMDLVHPQINNLFQNFRLRTFSKGLGGSLSMVTIKTFTIGQRPKIQGKFSKLKMLWGKRQVIREKWDYYISL